MTRAYLVELRQQKNASQQEVADAIGISRQYYSFIEAGTRQQKMDITLIVRLARFFGVEWNSLAKREAAYFTEQSN